MFAVVIASSSLFLLYYVIKFKKIKYLLSLLSTGFGSLTLFLIHPGALNVLSSPDSFQNNAARLINTLHGYLGFFAANTIGRYITILLVLALVVTLLFSWFKNRQKLLDTAKHKNFGILLYFFTSIAGLIHLLYIFEMTPPHAVGGVAWDMFWPFFSMTLAWLLFEIITIEYGLKPIIIGGFCLVVVYSSFFYVNNNTYLLREWSSDLENKIGQAKYIVTDQAKRGYLPAIIHKLDSDQQIYVDETEEIKELILSKNVDHTEILYLSNDDIHTVPLN
jgi:hypothetical protein